MPHAANGFQGSHPLRLVHNLVQVERVSAGDEPQTVGARRVDFAVEYGPQQGCDVSRAEWLHVQSLRDTVSPQCRDRVLHRFARTNRDQETHTSRGCEMVQQCRRQRVDQVRVVDRDDQRALGGPLLERAPNHTKEVDRLGRSGRVRRQQRGDRAEGETLCRPGRDQHLRDRDLSQVVQDLLHEARLAGAHGGDDYDTPAFFEQHVATQSQLRVAPDEWPSVHAPCSQTISSASTCHLRSPRRESRGSYAFPGGGSSVPAFAWARANNNGSASTGTPSRSASSVR